MTTSRSFSRREKGGGSWTKLDNNKWKLTVTVGRGANNKQIRRSKTGTKKECQQWAKSLEGVTSNDRFYDYAMKWLELRKNEYSERTISHKQQTIRIISEANNFQIKKCDDFTIKNLLQEIKQNKNRNSFEDISSTLKQVLTYAFFNKHLQSMPYIPRHIGNKNRIIKSAKVVPLSDVKKVLFLSKSSPSQNMYPILLLGFSTGMRIGEILALSIDDVDLENSTINIHKTVSKYAGGGVFIQSHPKTKASMRLIYVNPAILEEVFSVLPKKDTSLLFSKYDSGIIDVSSMSNRFKTFVKLRGFNFSAHSMRHTFITEAQNAHIDWRYIANYAGHVCPGMTLSTYTHIDISKPNAQLDNFTAQFLLSK